MDFKNMLERPRLECQEISRTQAVISRLVDNSFGPLMRMEAHLRSRATARGPSTAHRRPAPPSVGLLHEVAADPYHDDMAHQLMELRRRTDLALQKL